jgi:hypothetical protein
MSDTPTQPFRATTPRIEARSGWSVSLDQDDERLPDLPDAERKWWAVDMTFFAAHTADARAADELRYEQVKWAIEQHAAAGTLLPGPAEAGLWPIRLPDGTTEYALLVSYWNEQDFRQEENAIRYADRYNGHTRPHDPNVGRWAGSRRHDEFGRVIRGVADLL